MSPANDWRRLTVVHRPTDPKVLRREAARNGTIGFREADAHQGPQRLDGGHTAAQGSLESDTVC